MFHSIPSYWLGLLTLFVEALPSRAEPPRARLGIEDAVTFALAHQPALAAQDATTEVRGAQVAIAQSGYLPNVNLSAQLNDGTGNVLRGSLFSMREIPAVSGPPTGRSFSDASFGSALCVGASWNALGLIRQMAEVDAALAEQQQAQASLDAARLEVGFTTADQFMDVLGKAETVRAARATVERSRVFVGTVKALVDQDLRPGAEYSRASAELALASTQLIRAEQAEELSRTELARVLGVAGQTIEIIPGRLLAVAPPTELAAALTKNPMLAQAEAAVQTAQAKKHSVSLQYLPRLDLVAALWVRGSGLTSGALTPSSGSGILPDTPNWAAGLVLTWPVLEMVTVRARVRVEAAQVKVAEAQRRQVEQTVQGQIDGARAILAAARRVAENTPVAFQAARDAEHQATARYRSGLATVVEVAEAQRLLAQAEIDDAVARLGVRRAELLLARAVGDLGPFFASIHEGGK